MVKTHRLIKSMGLQNIAGDKMVEIPEFSTGLYKKKRDIPNGWEVTAKGFMLVDNNFKPGSKKPVLRVTDGDGYNWNIELSNNLSNKLRTILGPDSDNWTGKELLVTKKSLKWTDEDGKERNDGIVLDINLRE